MSIDTLALATELAGAFQDGSLRVAAPSTRGEGFDMDAAYATEAAVAKIRCAGGAKKVGIKVGYANKAMWRVLKLETLVWAHMYDDTVHYAHGRAADLALPYYRGAKIEPEIVFKMKDAVADAANPLAAVEWIALGFEIVDVPFTEPQFQPVDFVAAWGLHQALVVGEPTRVEPEAIPALMDALAKFKVRLWKGPEMVEEGGGRNSLKSPALCLAEVAGAMTKRTGASLGAGDLLSSGTLTSGSPVAKGEVWSVEAEGLPVEGLSLRFL